MRQFKPIGMKIYSINGIVGFGFCFCHVNQSHFPGRHQSFRNCLCGLFRITKFAFMHEFGKIRTFQIYRAIRQHCLDLRSFVHMNWPLFTTAKIHKMPEQNKKNCEKENSNKQNEKIMRNESNMVNGEGCHAQFRNLCILRGKCELYSILFYFRSFNSWEMFVQHHKYRSVLPWWCYYIISI